MEDHDQTSCPFCTGDVSDEIVSLIMEAAAGPMSPAMTIEEFRVWLDGVGRDAAPEAR